MPTLVATVGASTSNSFASETEFEDYCDARLNASAWTDASEDDRVRALIEATRELNVLTYVGDTVDETQALLWPRQYAPDPDSPLVGVSQLAWFATTVIPQRIKDATCELALQFLIAGTTDLSLPDSSQGVIEKTVGPLTTRWADPYLRATGLKRFPRVWNTIKPLLVTHGNSVPMVRG
jgi:hypothetical protein